MIPDLQSCLLCDDVRREHNGKLILIGLFDSIASPKFPLAYPRICMVTHWCSGQGNFQHAARILKPDEEVLVQVPAGAINLASPEVTAKTVSIIGNVQFESPGTHWVEVMIDGDLKLRFPLRVNQIQQGAVTM